MKTSFITCIDCGEITPVPRKKGVNNVLRCQECDEKYFEEIMDNVNDFADNIIEEA